MSRRFMWTIKMIPLLLLTAVLGCGQGDLTADPLAAQDALRQALELWKTGGSASDLQKTSGIVMSDVDWKNKKRLLQYQILPDGRSDGTNLHLTANLVLQGQPAKRPTRVTYIVGTKPVITIHRDE